MSEACALIEVTQEPSFRPPRKYSLVVRFFPIKYMPMQIIKIRYTPNATSVMMLSIFMYNYPPKIHVLLYMDSLFFARMRVGNCGFHKK